MGQLVFQAALGGQVNLVGPNTASTLNINVPAFAGTMASLAAVNNNGVAYVNSSGQPTTLSTFVFDGTNVGVGTASPTQTAANRTVLSVNGTTTAIINLNAGGVNKSYFYFDGTNTSLNAISGILTLQNDSANAITFNTNGGNERVRIDSAGNMGINTGAITQLFGNYTQLGIKGGSTVAGGTLQFTTSNGTITTNIVSDTNATYFAAVAGGGLAFSVGGTGTGTERGRFDGSGNFLVGTTSAISSSKVAIACSMNAFNGLVMQDTGSTGGNYVQFLNSAPAQAGAITHNGTTTVLYTATSDYRLKKDIQPMQNALARVSQLKPVTYKWLEDDSYGEGFIAHELQDVIPKAVAGIKDAIDADGKPKYQGIDTSVLVATLTAAIQELNAKVTALENK